jgi:hypothetical protein
MALNLFSGVTYPIVGIVVALILFDGLKEGILLPIFDGMYQPAKLRDTETHLSYEKSGALVVQRGPFVFRIGYLVSRVLLALLLAAVVLPCMSAASPAAAAEVPADVGAEPRLALEESAEAASATPVASSQGKVAAAGGHVPAAAAAAHHHLVAAV